MKRLLYLLFSLGEYMYRYKVYFVFVCVCIVECGGVGQTSHPALPIYLPNGYLVECDMIVSELESTSSPCKGAGTEIIAFESFSEVSDSLAGQNGALCSMMSTQDKLSSDTCMLLCVSVVCASMDGFVRSEAKGSIYILKTVTS